MIEIVDSNNIYISGHSDEVGSVIKRKLTIRNPEYTKAIERREFQRLYGIQKEYSYYKEVGDTLIAPKGFLPILLSALKTPPVVTKEKINISSSEIIQSNIVLREYQKEVYDRLQFHDRGVLHLSTGWGKTILSLHAIAESGKTGTIIVKDLTTLYMFVETAEKMLGYTPGIIGDSHKEIKAITIATAQTLKQDREILEKLGKHTSILFIDECHVAISEQSIEMLEAFSPIKMFGLTGTPRRSKDDGRTDAINFIYGPVVVKDEVKKMTPKVIVYATGADIPTRPKQYHKMIEEMITHEGRNKLIAGIAAGEMLSGRKTLVLTKRVKHAETLSDMLPMAHLIQKDTKGKKEILSQMKSGEMNFRGIIGTTSLLGTGFDIPQLDTLLIVGDIKSDVLTEQICGRVLRLLEGKEPKIIDFMDNKNGILYNQFNFRKQIYKKRNWEFEYFALDKDYKFVNTLKKYDR